MGIGNIFKQLYFGGENSGDYGLYITGAGVFNAPERDAEMITIPGRNGSFALDHGRFENIEITYPAGCFGNTEADFADSIASIRAWLCSKRGYVRLEDDYHPNEYRMAVYKSGLEVDPALLRAGEFEITFEAMPQRFLKSGEDPQEILSSGETINNPTLFNSRPMLEVEGYGKIGINGSEIEIISEDLGDVVISPPYGATRPQGYSADFIITPDYSALRNGDEVYFDPQLGAGYMVITAPGPIVTISGFSQTGGFFKSASFAWAMATIQIDNDFSFYYGTAATASASFSIIYGEAALISVTCNLSIDAAGVISINITTSGNKPISYSAQIGPLHAYSTKTALGSPLYIDLDIGEAYKIENDEIVSVNSGVSLGAELPELPPGLNMITFENTITDLKIVPRWWTV